MKRVVLLLLTVFAVSPAALALDFMGPPRAQLETGGLRLSFDYTYSKNDLEFTDLKDQYIDLSDSSFNVNEMASVEVDKIKLHKSYVNLHYGISDGLEGFLKIGAVRVRSEKFLGGGSVSFDGNCEPSIGFGGRATLYQEGNLTLGLLGQATYTDVEDTVEGNLYPYNMDLRFWEIQAAFGPTYRLNEVLSVYGGPFYHYFKGDLRLRYSNNGLFDGRTTANVETDSYFGAYLGMQAQLTDRTFAVLEYQAGESAEAVGVNLALAF